MAKKLLALALTAGVAAFVLGFTPDSKMVAGNDMGPGPMKVNQTELAVNDMGPGPMSKNSAPVSINDMRPGPMVMDLDNNLM